MTKIIYFGTEGNGKAGHYPMGIDKAGHYPMGIDKGLTHEEYDIWSECDNQVWIDNIYKNPGRHLIKHHGIVYTNYAVPFSVDDDRDGSHTEVFWEGIHSEKRNDRTHKEQFFLETTI